MREEILDTIDSLDDLLDAERDAVLDGNLDKVARLADQKEQLMQDLGQSSGRDTIALEALDAKVNRNQVLLHSALNGIQTVIRRLESMRRIRNSLDTYDSYGRRRTVKMQMEHTVEKRA